MYEEDDDTEYSRPRPRRRSRDEGEGGGGKAIASLVLGLIGLLAWCIPLFGLPIGLIGVILGFMDLNSENRGMAIGGIVLSGICLLASIINAIAGAYMVMQGDHPFVQ